jgi:hypothetical protein
MPEHPKRLRDLNQWAKHMVDLATGNATVAALTRPKMPQRRALAAPPSASITP